MPWSKSSQLGGRPLINFVVASLVSGFGPFGKQTIWRDHLSILKPLKLTTVQPVRTSVFGDDDKPLAN